MNALLPSVLDKAFRGELRRIVRISVTPEALARTFYETYERLMPKQRIVSGCMIGAC
jgi:hypothetical protein